MNAAIRVENLSKSYTIRHEHRARYVSLRDAIESKVRGMARRSPPVDVEEFWALKDVSFELQHGVRLGVIGRNGAGKSTLLKLLSRISEPTAGRIEIGGRVASLLEVGTGFHPELSGRENIFLNGAILGMSKVEINRQFDAIVEFAEVERFLDTPVKRYSSGMYVRLAFAVAAHLEADILIVDEVLAVGDLRFQEKCLAKMRDVTSSGRTVIFVSHNMAAIKRLCTRALLLDSGRIVADGPVGRIAESYEQRNLQNGGVQGDWDRSGSGRVRIESIKAGGDNPGAAALRFGGDLKIDIAGRTSGPGVEFSLAIQITTAAGLPVLYGYDQFLTFFAGADEAFHFEATIRNVALMPATYFVNVWVGQAGIEDFDYVKFAAPFEVVHTEQIRITAAIDQGLGLVIADLNLKKV